MSARRRPVPAPPRTTLASAASLPELRTADARELVERAVLDGVLLERGSAPGALPGGLRLLDSHLRDLVLDEADLTGAHVVDSVLERVSAVAAHAARGSWGGSLVTGCRLSALRGAGSVLRATRFTDCRLDGADLREAALTDVEFSGCDLRDADLSDARLTRVSFTGCDLARTRWTGARSVDVDLRGADLGADDGGLDVAGLRGATIDPGQLHDIAPVLAALAGLAVVG